MQLLQCTIATRLPSGVVTMSIISYGLDNSFSNTIMENEEVPADTFPVRCLTALVATMPVPASPSGGQTGIPAFKWPDTSSPVSYTHLTAANASAIKSMFNIFLIRSIFIRSYFISFSFSAVITSSGSASANWRQ